MSARTIIADLLRFARGAPESPQKAALIKRTELFRKAQRGAHSRPEHRPPDRLPGIVAAVSYLLSYDKTISSETFCQSIEQRTLALES